MGSKELVSSIIRQQLWCPYNSFLCAVVYVLGYSLLPVEKANQCTPKMGKEGRGIGIPQKVLWTSMSAQTLTSSGCYFLYMSRTGIVIFPPQLSHFPVFPKSFFIPPLQGDARAQKMGASAGAADEEKHHAQENTGKRGARHFTLRMLWFCLNHVISEVCQPKFENIRMLLWDHLLPCSSANQTQD